MQPDVGNVEVNRAGVARVTQRDVYCFSMERNKLYCINSPLNPKYGNHKLALRMDKIVDVRRY